MPYLFQVSIGPVQAYCPTTMLTGRTILIRNISHAIENKQRARKR